MFAARVTTRPTSFKIDPMVYALTDWATELVRPFRDGLIPVIGEDSQNPVKVSRSLTISGRPSPTDFCQVDVKVASSDATSAQCSTMPVMDPSGAYADGVSNL
jgi:hypothetical protein